MYVYSLSCEVFLSLLRLRLLVGIILVNMLEGRGMSFQALEGMLGHDEVNTQYVYFLWNGEAPS